MRESDIVSAIRLAVGRDPDVVIWRNSGGVATAASGNVQRLGFALGRRILSGFVGGVFWRWKSKPVLGALLSSKKCFCSSFGARADLRRLFVLWQKRRRQLDGAKRGE